MSEQIMVRGKFRNLVDDADGFAVGGPGSRQYPSPTAIAV
jgi:hypothetical protein